MEREATSRYHLLKRKPVQSSQIPSGKCRLELLIAEPKWISRTDDESRTPLHVAARFGAAKVVKWLVENGANVNAIAYNGFTPLHLIDNATVVSLILKKKPDLSIRDRITGMTPLQDAVENLNEAVDAGERKKWKAIVQVYLDAGAVYDLFTAIRLDDLKRVQAILKKSPQLADSFQEQSPLRLAASLGRFDICRYLIEKQQTDVDDFKRGTGYPIIKSALAYPKVVKLLIKNGADLNKRITWRGGRTGIWIIGDDATALHVAARDGVPETIKILIDNGVDIFATTKDIPNGSLTQTALEVASTFGRADNAIAILNHRQFKQTDKQQRQKLLDDCLWMGASMFGDIRQRSKLIEALIKRGANPNVARDGTTAVMSLASDIHTSSVKANRGIAQAIAVLRKHGANVGLRSAVAIGDEKLVDRLLKQNPKLADQNSGRREPALHFAIKMNYVNIVKTLLAAGCDVDIRDKDDQDLPDETALSWAAWYGRYEIAKLLLAAGAEVNARDRSHSTPLHAAADLRNPRLARLLLENGANLDARDKDGNTPFEWCLNLEKSKADGIGKLYFEYRDKKKTP